MATAAVYVYMFLKVLIPVSIIPLIIIYFCNEKFRRLKKLAEKCFEAEAEILSIRRSTVSNPGKYGQIITKRCHITFRYTANGMEYNTEKTYIGSQERQMNDDIQNGRTIIYVSRENPEVFELKQIVDKRKKLVYYGIGVAAVALLTSAVIAFR